MFFWNSLAFSKYIKLYITALKCVKFVKVKLIYINMNLPIEENAVFPYVIMCVRKLFDVVVHTSQET